MSHEPTNADNDLSCILTITSLDLDIFLHVNFNQVPRRMEISDERKRLHDRYSKETDVLKTKSRVPGL